MRKTMTFVAIMLLAVAANATAFWEETFDRNGTYIEKVEGQYWPYADQWFTGYTGGSGEVTGARYSFGYTNVTCQGVSIRAKKLNGASQNTIGLYFPANKTEDKAFVQFEGTLAASAGDRYLVFEICSPESSGGDLGTMVVKVNGNAVTVPTTTLGAQYKTSTVYIELPNEAISSLYFAFNNVPSQKFITHPRIVAYYNVITYTATSKLSGYNGSLDVGETTFGSAITSHSFSNGTGTITCNGEITTIGYAAFAYCSGLTSVEIPYSVKTIDYYAFAYCSGLTSVEIPYFVKNIWDYAFAGCTGLTSVTIPNSVTNIWDYAFAGCTGLTSVTIPNSVTTIREGTFDECTNLTSVTIPSSVTAIGDYAFWGCNSLISITIPHSVTTIGVGAFYGCSGLTSVTIGNSVTTIGYAAFAECTGLTSVMIPNSVTTIGDCAFWNCSGLTSVTIPNSVTAISDSTFVACTGLTSVFIPNSVTTIGDGAFYYCTGLTSVSVPNSVTTIGDGAFYYCDGLTSITCCAITPPTCGSDCFYSVNETIPVYVPIQSVDAYKQADEWKEFMNIQAIKQGQCGEDLYWQYNDALLVISGTGAMYDYTQGTAPWIIYFQDSINNLVINNGCTSIGNNAFANCTVLTSVTIPNSVTTIGDYAFYKCSGLSYIDFGCGLKEIGDYAFAGCHIDTAVIYSTTPPVCTPNNGWGGGTFNGLSRYAYLFVPQDCERAYKLADGWEEFDIHVMESNVVPSVVDVTVTPSDNAVQVTWPISDNAVNYAIVITKGGEEICTLNFNAQGQLINIAFAAPSHDGSRQAPAATLTAQGYQFTVTGLTPGTAYNYSVKATDAQGETIAEHKGNFSTTGGATTNINQTQDTKHQTLKYLRNGQLLINRNGQHYSAMGERIR